MTRLISNSACSSFPSTSSTARLPSGGVALRMTIEPKKFSLRTRSVHGGSPGGSQGAYLVAGALRLVGRADGDACTASRSERGRAERRRLALGRDLDGDTEQVSLEL